MARKKQDWTPRGPAAQIQIVVNIEGQSENGEFNLDFLKALVSMYLTGAGFEDGLTDALRNAPQPAAIVETYIHAARGRRK